MKKFTLQKISGFDESWEAKIEGIMFSKETLKFGTREVIKFNFLYSRDKYGVVLKAINDKGDFRGDIICNNEKVGFCLYTLYKNKSRTILVGEWIEEGDKVPSVIELIE